MFNIKAHNTVRTYRIIGIPIVLLSEPTRVFRRQFILSHATLADSSNRR